jgi:CelD/BcsL family acetyltransferase involved in cellulose biosynthesis
MIRVFGSTPGHVPFAVAATNAEGRIVALLVSIQVKTLRSLASLSSRSIQFTEPLCDDTDEGRRALTELLCHHDEVMRTQTLFCEVRTLSAPGAEQEPLLRNGYAHQEYLNYLVDVRYSEEELWKRVDKKMRQKIKSSFRKGIVVGDDNSSEGVKRLHDLLQHSYARAGVPFADRQLFEASLAYLPKGVVRIRTAFDGDMPVASAIALVYRGRVFSWYGGTKRLRARSPFACIVWEDIRWGSQTGQTYYDFGGAGWPDEEYGPRRFKASFGGEEVRFGRYRATYSPVRLKLAEFAYSVSQRLGKWSGRKEHHEYHHSNSLPTKNLQSNNCGSGTCGSEMERMNVKEPRSGSLKCSHSSRASAQ